MVNDKSLRIKFGESSVDSRTLLVLFVILDLMFLPYIRALHCSAGMVLVVLWCVPNILGRIKEFTWFFIACVAISNLNGYLFHYVGTYGITQAILVIYSFILLDFFSEAGLEDRSRMIKCVLFLYVLFNFLLAMIYAASPEEYFSLRSTWTMSNTQIEFTGMRINRFTSIFSDPNNAGSALTAILAYILVYENVKPLTLAILCGFVFVCVVLTYSVTALILFVLVISLYLIFGTKSAEQRKKRNTLLFVVAVAAVVCGEFIFAANSNASSNPFIYTLQKRIEGNTENNSLGGRIPRWIELLTTVSPWDVLFVGKGLVLDFNGKVYQPHNGLLFLLYSYGLPSVLFYLKKFFSFVHKKLIYSLPILVIFVAIFINVGFSDYRFLTVSTLIIALTKAKAKTIVENTQK